MTDGTLMGSQQPFFCQRDNSVNTGQQLVRCMQALAHIGDFMAVADLPKTMIPLPVIGMHLATGINR